MSSCVVSVIPGSKYSKSNIEYWYELRGDPWEDIKEENDILGVYINGEKTESVILPRCTSDGPYYNAVETYFSDGMLVISTMFYNSSIWEWSFKITTPISTLERGKPIGAKVVYKQTSKPYSTGTIDNATIWFDSVYSEGEYTHLIGGFEFEGSVFDRLEVRGTDGIFHDRTRVCFFPETFCD